MESTRNEIYFSVDVETAGPNPAQYALLSIGACLVFHPETHFYAELQPDREAVTSEAMQITGLSLAELKERGLPPQQALTQFAEWVRQTTPANAKPVFVAFNAGFDWMFMADYFHRYLDHNPFGHKSLDMKAYYMGKFGCPWSETSYEKIASRYGMQTSLPHNALRDAVLQAHMFRAMLEDTNIGDQKRNQP